LTVVAIALACAAAALATGRHRGAARLSSLRRSHRARPRQLSQASACILGGIGVALFIGLPDGLVLGPVIALAGPALLSRLEPASVRRDRETLVRDLPLVLDLLAACLAGGSSLPAAASAVAAALPGPCGRRLADVGSALAAGMPAAEAWLMLAQGDPEDPLAAPARLLARAADGGAPVSAAVSRLSSEARADAAAAGTEAARRVGVLVVAPLGLCFLPAFVLLGIVPVVAGLAAPLLRTF
jgi:pilus assembly protein TadC